MKINSNAQQIIESRYLWHEKGEKTWSDIAKRVGTVVGGSIPSNPAFYQSRFEEIINDGLFIPGGRIIRNTGRPRGSLFNCYNIPFGDSIKEIGDGTSACMQVWKDGGGTGITWSFLRPKDTKLVSSGGVSSGPIPFMYGLNEMAKAIETGGQRRAAGLSLLSVSHPDIINFIKFKTEDGKLSHFNISIGITEEFIDSVRADREWPLIWNQQIYKIISARELWNLIIKGLNENGEPGIINVDNLCINNSYYFAPIIGTNPCGETCLEAWGCCNLGSIVLPNFVYNHRFQWTKLSEVIDLAVTFLDTIIDINNYTLPQIKQTAQRGRRIGLGVMGLADMYFKLGIRYGSEEALDFTERLKKFIRNKAYESSIKLASEKGSFPAFDSNPYCKAKFVKTLPASLRTDIRKYGIRNVTLLADAPTGTISLVPEVTSGIEPLSYKAYKRQDNVSTRYYIHPIYEESLKTQQKTPDYIVDSTDLKPMDHINTQAIIQKYTDGSVSKTILVPNDFKDDELSDLLLESIADLKGITVYREGSRTGQPLTPISEKETLQVIKKNIEIESSNACVVECSKGECGI